MVNGGAILWIDHKLFMQIHGKYSNYNVKNMIGKRKKNEKK